MTTNQRELIILNQYLDNEFGVNDIVTDDILRLVREDKIDIYEAYELAEEFLLDNNND